MNDIQTLTLYNAAWFWHIIGIQFMILGITAVMLGYQYIAGAGFLVLIGCEYVANKRKKEMLQSE